MGVVDSGSNIPLAPVIGWTDTGVSGFCLLFKLTALIFGPPLR